MRWAPRLGLLLLLPLATSAWAQTTEADVFVAQAILDIHDKRYDAVIADLRRALELDPGRVEALYSMGVAHMGLRRPGDAVPFLAPARERAPTDPSIASELGLAYFAQERHERAASLLEEVFRANPTLDGLGHDVGYLRYRRKDYRGAGAEALVERRATDPRPQRLTRFYTALSLVPLGLGKEAAAEVEQALQLAPGSPPTAPAERLRDTLLASRTRQRPPPRKRGSASSTTTTSPSFPIPARRMPKVAKLRAAKHRSTGEFVGVRADYARLRHFIAREDRESTAGYSFFGTYDNDAPKFNVRDRRPLGRTCRGTTGCLAWTLSAEYQRTHADSNLVVFD